VVTVIAAEAAQLLAHHVVLLCGQAFGTVEALQAATVAAFAGVRRGRPRRTDLSRLEAIAAEALVRPDPLVVGAGFVTEPGALAGAGHRLEWWTADDGSVQPLAVESDPEAPGFRDYTRLPWFDVPRRTGRRHVTGPYVDYLCTDEYTLTFTAPVVVDGRFVGVAGADVFARTVELALGWLLDDVRQPTAIVNAQGRVVAGNEGAPVTGELLRDVVPLWTDGAADGVPRLYRCADLPFAVAVGV
jgi:hypothetical protein